nr:MAG TPA: hypothetical protein [Caudoviricetes sp.]
MNQLTAFWALSALFAFGVTTFGIALLRDCTKNERKTALALLALTAVPYLIATARMMELTS